MTSQSIVHVYVIIYAQASESDPLIYDTFNRSEL